MWESQELFTPPGNPGCSQGAGGRASEDAFPCNLRHRVPRGRVLPGGSRHQLPRTRQETPQTHQARAPAPLRAATGPAGSELRKQTWKLPGFIAPVAAASRGDATHSQAWASAHTRASPQTHSAHMRASHVHVRVPTSGHVHASSAHVRASSDTLGSHACVTTDTCAHVRACITTDTAWFLLGCSARGDHGPSWDRTPTCLSIPTSASVHATCLQQRRTRAHRRVKPHPPFPHCRHSGGVRTQPPSRGAAQARPPPPQPIRPCQPPHPSCDLRGGNQLISHFPQDTVSSAWNTPPPTPTLRSQASSIQTPGWGWGLPWVMPKVAGACPTMTPHHQDQIPHLPTCQIPGRKPVASRARSLCLPGTERAML